MDICLSDMFVIYVADFYLHVCNLNHSDIIVIVLFQLSCF